jgi:L-ascorbate metabolism protein UlaG (beta-lactamase superfamily)
MGGKGQDVNTLAARSSPGTPWSSRLEASASTNEANVSVAVLTDASLPAGIARRLIVLARSTGVSGCLGDRGRACNVSSMATTLTWLGHAAFRIDTEAGTRVYIDPFLTGNPTCPDEEREPERCDLLVLSHGHEDHVGDAVAIAQRLDCPVVAQVELRGWLAGKGVPADVSLAPNKGGTVRVADVRVTLTDANHSSSAFVDDTFVYLGESCGLVVRPDDGPTIYFAGDTNVFGDMALVKRIYAPDVAVLPIGDHFTMGPEEAAVAAELVGAPRVVPSHYGTFPILTGTPDALRPLLPAGVELLAPQPGETLTL